MMHATIAFVLLILVSIFGMFHCSEVSNSIDNIRKSIVDHQSKAGKSAAYIYDIALNRLPGYERLKVSYEAFVSKSMEGFNNATNSECLIQPKEHVNSYIMPLTADSADLERFLEMPFIKNLPKKVRDKIYLIKYIAGSSTLVDTVSVLATEKNATLLADGNSSQQEYFEIGHVIIKIMRSRLGDMDSASLLILAPMVSAHLPAGCHFSQGFREAFVGLTQDIQTWIAIKSAENPTLAALSAKFATGGAVQPAFEKSPL